MNLRVQELERDGVIDFTRQRDWFDPTSITTRLNVIGSGGIGSLFTVLAGKLGIGEIVIFDNDLVEAHNLPNQFFPLDKVGHTKVDALKGVIEAMTIAEVTHRHERYDGTEKLRGLVVSGVDSMEARKQIWQGIKGNFLVPRYWDARIGGEKILIYSVNPRSPVECELFEKTLYSDEDAVDDPCTRRSVIDVMGHVGSHLLTGVRQQLAGESPSGFIYHNVKDSNLFSGELAIGIE
jgi:hypothetical protein